MFKREFSGDLLNDLLRTTDSDITQKSHKWNANLRTCPSTGFISQEILSFQIQKIAQN